MTDVQKLAEAGDWYALGMALDPVKLVGLVERFNLPNIKGRLVPRYMYPNYHRVQLPGRFAVQSGSRGWFIDIYFYDGINILVHPLNYDPTDCHATRCIGDCTCDELSQEEIDDGDECDTCNGECECTGCMTPYNNCETHNVIHPNY